MTKICGIYKITNLVNNKFYIGSSVDIERRWNEHKRELRRNNHHSILLQRAFLKYGESNFIYEILRTTNKTNLLTIEQQYLDELKPYKKNIGYNISSKAQNNVMYGENHPLYGKGHTEETKEKMRSKKVSIETKIKMSNNHSDVSGENNPMYGKNHTEEVKEKISIKNKGKFTGEKSPRAKINKEIAEKAKQLYATGQYTQHQLANTLNINRSTLSNIIYGRSWV